MKKLLGLFLVCFFSTSSPSYAAYDAIYEHLLGGSVLHECQCIPSLVRKIDCSQSLGMSLRGELDRQASHFVEAFAGEKRFANLVFIGSGRLLNELTVTASILERSISVKTFLIDPLYEKVNPEKDSFADFSLRALDSFQSFAPKFADRCKAKFDLSVCYECEATVSDLAKIELETVPTVFFMIDLTFPSVKALERFQGMLENGIDSSANPKTSFSTLFFVLGQKSTGNNCAEDDSGALEIYSFQVVDGLVKDVKMKFQKVI